MAASITHAGEKVRSFTVGFAGAADYYEERPTAERVARHLGTEHTTVEISSGDAAAALGDVFLGLDEPFAERLTSVPAIDSHQAPKQNFLG